MHLPPGDWSIVVDQTNAGLRTLRQASGEFMLPPYSMAVAHQ